MFPHIRKFGAVFGKIFRFLCDSNILSLSFISKPSQFLAGHFDVQLKFIKMFRNTDKNPMSIYASTDIFLIGACGPQGKGLTKPYLNFERTDLFFLQLI